MARLPAGTRLRSLITSEDASSGRRVELLGFRSGSTLCLRVDVSGQTRASTTSCAPLEELRQAGAPVRVGLADAGFGKGTKRAWYGIDRYAAPAIQVTAGIAADGVRSVIVEDASGRHTLRARSNAFLYVASNPDVGQRVTRIWARTGHGLVAIPFAPAPFGFGAGSSTRRPDRGPTRVERRVHDGTISWLDRRDPRGQPLEVLPPRLRKMVQHDAVFGRVVAPDPRRPVRVALTLSTSRHGGKAIGLCSWLISTGGHPGGGCAVRADLFATSPITADLTVTKSSDEFVTMYGLASDDVARIVAFPATGASTDVPLNDNVYVVDVARSRLLVRLVAYDTAGHVIGMTLPPGDWLRRSGAGTRACAAPAACALFERWQRGALGWQVDHRRPLHVRPLRHQPGQWDDGQLPRGADERRCLAAERLATPTQFVMGRVRSDVAGVELRFADGAHVSIKPTDGFILFGVPSAHVVKGHELLELVALDADGKPIGSESFRPRTRWAGRAAVQRQIAPIRA